jgi:sporulation protein YlmC with PRC-barrel domain
MADILAENLSNKSVMGTDGVELGKLYNITMERKSGALQHLLVEPDEATPTRQIDYELNRTDYDDPVFEVPTSRVQAVKDYIVIDR